MQKHFKGSGKVHAFLIMSSHLAYTVVAVTRPIKMIIQHHYDYQLTSRRLS